MHSDFSLNHKIIKRMSAYTFMRMDLWNLLPKFLDTFDEETKTMLVQELGPDVRELKVLRGVVDGDCSFKAMCFVRELNA